MAVGDLKYKGLLFGDDYWATVVDEEIPYKNDNGVEMKKYLIVPSSDLMDAYPQILKKPNILNVKTPIGNAIWREYPTSWVCDENPSRKNAIARIDCGFDGRETPLTKRFKKKDEEINNLMELNEIYRNRIFMMNEELKDALGDVRELAEKNAEIDKIGKKTKETSEDNYETGTGQGQQGTY